MSSVKRMTVAYTSSKELTTRTTPGGATAVSEQMEHTLILIHEDALQPAQCSSDQSRSSSTLSSEALSSQGTESHSRMHFSDWDVVSESVKSDEEYDERKEDAELDKSTQSHKGSNKRKTSGRKKTQKNNKALRFMMHVARNS